MDNSRALPPGTMVARDWRIERMLGAGGFGVTYEARHRTTGAHVALKEYMPSGHCTRVVGSSQVVVTVGPAGDVFKRGLQSFMKEAETLARLDHPSIVRVTKFFEANGTAYMALAFESGGNLSDWLQGLGRQPTQIELDRLLWPLSEALIQVHSLHLLHRDIKPDNIMLRPDGRPVLIDFGAVKQLVSSHSRTVNGPATLNVATDGFAPPEQYVADGESLLGPWTDVYALAATLYQAVTGKPPPPAPRRTVEETYRPVTEKVNADGGWRPEFLAGINQALSLRRSDRPQSMVELRRSMGIAAPQAIAPLQPTLVAARTSRHPPSTNPIPPPIGRDEQRLEGTHGSVGNPVHLPQLPQSAPAIPANRAPSDVPVNANTGTSLKPGPIQSFIEKLLIGVAAVLAAIWIAKTTFRFISSTVSSTTQHSTAAPRSAAPDPIAMLLPGSGQSARDRLADGSECSFCPEMVVVPAGPFTMGSPASEPQRDSDESQVQVTIPRPFAVGKFAVTFDEWDACVADGGCGGYKPADQGWGRGKRPVINVNWNDAKVYAAWLSVKTGKTYRLPSETEREYFARAGTTTPFWWGSSITPAQANYDGNFTYTGSGSKGEYRQRTVPVDSFQANPWGLFNVHGNVWEWTEDCWIDRNTGNPGNGEARTTGCTDASRRVVRGGSWGVSPPDLRSANRYWITTVNRSHNLGFRLARTLNP